MRRAVTLGIPVVCAALLAACGSQGQGTTNSFQNSEASRPQPVEVRGCLTASGDRFVLTELQDASSAARPTTETYQLTRTADQPLDLKKWVGQVVQVTGEAAPAKVADVRQSAPATPTATTGQQSAASTDTAPKVATSESLRIANRTLAVASVTPTGEACIAAAPRSSR
jgi:hypothetical protein